MRKPPAKPRKRSSTTRKRGQPTKCTPERIAVLERAHQEGLGRKAAAEAAGVSPAVLYQWLARGRAGEAPYVELLERVEGGRDAVVEELHGIVLGLARSEDPHVAGTNARWLLQCLKPDVYGQKRELTGAKGGPVQVEAKVGALLSDDAVAEMDGEKLADTLAGLAAKTREGT